jgi:hypothetical protein
LHDGRDVSDVGIGDNGTVWVLFKSGLAALYVFSKDEKTPKVHHIGSGFDRMAYPGSGKCAYFSGPNISGMHIMSYLTISL